MNTMNSFSCSSRRRQGQTLSPGDERVSARPRPPHCCDAIALLLLLLLLKSVEFDDDVALLLSVAGLVMGPRETSESEIVGTDSTALRTSRTCLRLCASCVTGCTSFFRGSDPAI